MIKIPDLKKIVDLVKTPMFFEGSTWTFEGNLLYFQTSTFPALRVNDVSNEASDDLIQISLPRVFDIQVGKPYHLLGDFFPLKKNKIFFKWVGSTTNLEKDSLQTRLKKQWNGFFGAFSFFILFRLFSLESFSQQYLFTCHLYKECSRRILD